MVVVVVVVGAAAAAANLEILRTVTTAYSFRLVTQLLLILQVW
jgi:hypothetical protein